MKSKELKVQRIEYSYISPDGEICFEPSEGFYYVHKGYVIVDKKTKKVLKSSSSTHSSGFEVWAYRYNAVNRLMGIEQSKSEENKIPPLEEGIDPSWINSFKGCI